MYILLHVLCIEKLHSMHNESFVYKINIIRYFVPHVVWFMLLWLYLYLFYCGQLNIYVCVLFLLHFFIM